MTRRTLEDIEHAIESAAAVTLVEVRADEIIVTMPGATLLSYSQDASPRVMITAPRAYRPFLP